MLVRDDQHLTYSKTVYEWNWVQVYDLTLILLPHLIKINKCIKSSTTGDTHTNTFTNTNTFIAKKNWQKNRQINKNVTLFSTKFASLHPFHLQVE